MYKVLDLFSGAGGFSLGFELCGFNIDTHVEIDSYASKTLEKNFKNSRIITDDIRFIDPKDIADEDKFDLIIGGPPCQGFSVAGSSQFNIEDDRNELVFWYLKYVQVLKPKIAIIENVPNVLTKRSKDGLSFLDLIKKIGLEMGYEVSFKILNSKNFGVPQSRRRAFIVLHSPRKNFNFPEVQNHEAKELSLFSDKANFVTVDEAFNDLPEVDAGEIGTGFPYAFAPKNDYQKYCRKNSKGVFNHDPMKHTKRVIDRFKIIKPGQSLKDVPISHGQVAYGTGEKVIKPFKYNNYRLDPNKTSLTIPASYQSLFIHPSKHRNLTAREGARLMSFPDWYVFEGPKTLMSWENGLSQYNQIGNAVCPLVAKSLASSALDYLNQTQESKLIVKTSKTLSGVVNKLNKQRYGLDDAKNGLKVFKTSMKIPYSVLRGSKYFDNIRNIFVVNKIDIPIENVQNAFNLIHTSQCTICNQNEPPYGNHDKFINLLISKSDINSLIGNKKDNGLDFHLRILSNEDRRTANEVAEILQDLNLVELMLDQNPRTGKMVKSIKLK
tara:strand:- start:2 stop:1657 length:1656 start_codon:yes stop_codon:yes gene_type:complete